MARSAASETEQQIHAVRIILLHHSKYFIAWDGRILADEYRFALWP
jgi:hypothetical protein